MRVFAEEQLRQRNSQNWVKMFAIVESHKDTRRNIVFTTSMLRFLSLFLSRPYSSKNSSQWHLSSVHVLCMRMWNNKNE